MTLRSKSNIDTSHIPDFASFDEAVSFFKKMGDMKFFGWEMSEPMSGVHSLMMPGNREHLVFIANNGEFFITDVFKQRYGV